MGMNCEEKRMMEVIDSKREDIHRVAKKIWEFAEVGWEEFKSSSLLMDELERQGFEVQRGLVGKNPKLNKIIDMPTAFKATYTGKEGGPVVAVVLEYDAMPNGHSCGHNLIASAGFAAALGLKDAFSSIGSVIVYGSPAEEVTGSKHFILEGGHMEGVDLMLACHYGSRWVSEVTQKAMAWHAPEKRLTFKGKTAHSSSEPENGRSALDAVILTSIALEFLREHTVETDRIHYVITNGGAVPNAVPDLATLSLEVRANSSEELNSLMEKVDNIVKGAELMTETTAEYEWDAPMYCATPVPSLYHMAADYANDLGIDGSKFPFGAMPKASTDLGCIAYEIPTVEITFPIVKDDEVTPIGHSNEIAALTCQEFPIDQSILAGKLMALTGYRVGADPENLAKIKEEFKKNYNG
ncbi:MAG: amidohydrolase [Lachnospiraceae bacterium]